MKPAAIVVALMISLSGGEVLLRVAMQYIDVIVDPNWGRLIVNPRSPKIINIFDEVANTKFRGLL